MEIENLKPIPNKPALWIKNRKVLVIADLHIGIEREFGERGFNIPSQTTRMMKSILSICEAYSPKEIILLGDVKHNISFSFKQERKDVKKLLDTLKEYAEVHIVRGNHDGNIQKIAPKDIYIHPSGGFIKENIGFFHGHSWPHEEVLNCKNAVTAHTHPMILLIDRLNHRSFEPCWIKSNLLRKKLKIRYPNSNCFELLIMPAFNTLCGGIAVNHEGVIGPLGKLIDVENSETYLLDGTFLGKVKNIKGKL